MSERRVAWVLNLDADLELAAGKGYSPSRGVLAAMAPQRTRLSFVGRVIEEGERFEPGEWVGRAFCPTPRALAMMRHAGVEPEPYPDYEVLRRVNSREFCAALGQTLPGAVYVRSLDEARAVVASAPPAGRQWRAKRAFGMAGRGQRPLAAGPLADADASFLQASLERDGGIQIEPEVVIDRELAIHGLLDLRGDVRLGRVVEQRCDASGQWLESLPYDAQLPELVAEARSVATALHGAGYFGPFGVDAYFYEARLQPRSEINARYSMGFPASGLL